MGRAPCCDKANVKKGPWSPEEDAKLKSHIEKHGTGGNWIALPPKIGLKRCGKSCRLRWLNYLRPNIKHGGFTEDEDNLICSLYVSIGSRWSIIAAQLPGRTDNDIKNYWNTKLKKKLLGKQCREQQTRKKLGITEKGCSESYSINKESFSLYPQPQQQVAPPFRTNENRLHDPPSNSLTNISSIMPQVEAVNFSCDDTQPNNQGKIFEVSHSISDVSCAQLYQQICKDSPLENDIHINLPPFDGMYDSMSQLLDGANSFSPIDIAVNSSTISSSSLENTSWGDTSSIVYPCTSVTDYEVYHQEMPQYCTLFEEPRLLGYSQ